MNLFPRIVLSPVLLLMAVLGGAPAAHAYVWIDKGVATGPEVETNASEGTSVAMWGDLLVVGAPKLNKPAIGGNLPVLDAGGVQIYRRTSGGWSLDQTLYSTHAVTDARFGASVAIWDNVIVVGEPYYTPPAYPNFVHNGRALIYVYSPSTQKFVFQKEIFQFGMTSQLCLPPNCLGPEYGVSVDVVGGPGGRFAVAVGAPGEDVLDYDASCDHFDSGCEPWQTFYDEGSTLVVRFDVTPEGTIQNQNDLINSWQLKAPLSYVVGSNVIDQGCHITTDICIQATNKRRYSGWSVALARADCPSSSCEDSYYVVVGAPGTDIDYGSWDDDYFYDYLNGAAWVFRIDSFSRDTSPVDVRQQWRAIAPPEGYPDISAVPFLIQKAYLYPPALNDQHFGTSVDIRVVNDTPEIIVGAEGAEAPSGTDRPGAAYYFKNFSGMWYLRQTLYASSFGTEENFGQAVSFSGDRLLVSAPGRPHIVNSQTVLSGSVFDFEQTSPLTWAQTYELYREDGMTLEGGVAGSQDWIAAGAPAARDRGATATWQRGWNFTVTPPTNGTIQLTPPLGPLPGVSCPLDCNFQYENGRHISPLAVPDDGYTFSSWSGAGCDAVTSPSCAITIDGDKTLSATFSLNVSNTRTLTLGITDGSGTITADASSGPDLTCPEACDGIYAYGTSVALLATPAPGFEFVSWTGCPSPGGNTCAVVMNTWRNITAAFQPVTGNKELSVEFLGSGAGLVTITTDQGSTSCQDTDAAPCKVSLPANASVSVDACTTSGSTFMNWGSACSGTGLCGVLLDSDKQVTATFETSSMLFRSDFEETQCPVGWFR